MFSLPSGCSLTIYKAKKKKVLCILSSMHRNINIDQCHKKKLPETIQYCNKSKVGVDVLDQVARYHTSKSSTRRWPVAVFFNILDCACINAYIIYCLTTKLKLSRRQFMLELIKRTLQTKRWSGLNTSFSSSGSHSQHCIAGNQWFSTESSEKKRVPVCSM